MSDMVDLDSAKGRIASSVDPLIARLPAGTRITIDIGETPDFGVGPAVQVSVGTPLRMAGLDQLHWQFVGTVTTDFGVAMESDHESENALHDAFEGLRRNCVEWNGTR